ncbi:hypothetical protein GLOTRDRAFT_126569 [Gloeophyllum trabeum ATCC 11539]|uniref:Fungal-type protein kinase domain-containing protein n=1 Tax=Gloeophyllum trabeum (strain ATCC 11539 / FP-39264 / Madison 617) TaxID=670483 RepID=S7RXK1_GLOTA|nr:uncharacterized protein GLOTRDRAFT_126569 [Gloeophyllum trabeum ATCC 11539]EPQ58084.1 hypothetical protein GLOTRDRAFT_126569 [Gloeophyllum trabeum ATCC 11539]
MHQARRAQPIAEYRQGGFYEQLDTAGATKIIVPRNFGFFIAQCSRSQVVPWRDDSWAFHDKKLAKTYDIYDELFSESEDLEYYSDDEHKSNESSQWKHWKWNKDGIQDVGLMIMGRVGKEMTAPAMYTFYSGQREEVYHLLQDLAWAGVWHDDLRLSQIVRRKPTVVCPRHGYAHRWRIIDFDRACAITAVDEERGLLARVSHQLFKLPLFWGGDE